MQNERIGVIGLGLLGSALAERFTAAGCTVHGFDIDAARRERLVASGGTAASTAVEVASSCRRLVLSLPDSNVVGRVAEELIPHVAPHSYIVDTTTGDPEATAELGQRLAESRIFYLDATVAGSSEQARRGEVIVMVGADAAAFAACADLFATISRRSFHIGPCGSGARMKLVVNLVLGLNRAVLAEGLAFAQSSGLDPAAALRVLKSSAAYSRVMDTKGEKMIAGDFTPQARLRQHLKDVGLILDQASGGSQHLPFTELHRRILESLVASGHGDADNSVVIKAYERKSPGS